VVLCFGLKPSDQETEEAMKLRYALLLSVLSSAGIGAAVHNLHAQTKPPVYMIAINEVSNQEGYAKESAK
jgi:hypothetical protein